MTLDNYGGQRCPPIIYLFEGGHAGNQIHEIDRKQVGLIHLANLFKKP
jgi:hypothetical protein